MQEQGFNYYYVKDLSDRKGLNVPKLLRKRICNDTCFQ